MVILATAATVIASQAVISGAFSLTQQAAQLGYLPRLRIDAHLGGTGRPDLRALDQLGAVRRGAGARLHLPHLDRAGLRLRRGGHRHDHHHHAAVLLHRPQPVAEAALARRCPAPPCCSPSTCCSSRPTSPSCRTAPGCRCHRPRWCSPSSPPGRRAASWSAGSAQHDEGSLREFVDELHAKQAAAAAGAGHRGLPQPGQGDRAAGPAGERRAQPRAARPRHHPGHRDAAASRTSRRASGWRSTTSATRTTGSTTSPPASATWTRPTSRAAAAHPQAGRARGCWTCSSVSYFLSTIEVRRGNTPGMSRVAQAPVPRHHPADRRRRRVLPAPPRPHGHHGRAHRTLTGCDGGLPRAGPG